MRNRQEIERENEWIWERYTLCTGRIQEIGEETGGEKWNHYFAAAARFLMSIADTANRAADGKLRQMSMEECKKHNQLLFQYIRDEEAKEGEESLACYRTGYANPNYAVNRLGDTFGPVFSFLFSEFQSLIPCAYEYRLFDITILMELFLEIYHYIQEEEGAYDSIKSAIYYHYKDYCADLVERRIREMLDSALSYAADIIMDCDLSDLKYLYYFGEYITENEIATAKFLNTLPESKINEIAAVYTQGYKRGFLANRIDFDSKSTVNIRFCIGFERIVKAAVLQFKEMGLTPIIYRASVGSINRRQHLKVGYYSSSTCHQFDYDHRFDEALYLNKSFVDRKLTSLRNAYEKYKEAALVYGGPAVIEVFGEPLFSPEDKRTSIRLSEPQRELSVKYQREASIITNEYISGEATSFTIISFPIPKIGNRFKEIFHDTVRVNSLDVAIYEKIQQKIIDVLDTGCYVRIKGRGRNRTDLKVMLHELSDPAHETNFENCLADVNIPAGEVFTSPKLKGTKGVLHVGLIYLNDLKYQDLALTFQDGMIISYTCSNFEREEENKQFIKENLMYQRETLPLGEFAIGTNTAAYQMGRKYQIWDRLPILIAEKTGPHFAVGDTCYKMSEDVKVYNPDGKEITARDNECSLIRKTSPEKAYFNCHTDITIPYDELGEIAVYTKEGDKIPIIENGRFVLPGTQLLNKPLE